MAFHTGELLAERTKHTFPILWRLLVLSALLAAEAVGTSLLFNAIEIFHSLGEMGLGGTVARGAVWATHFLIAFAGLFLTFLYLRERNVLTGLAAFESRPINVRSALAHCVSLAAFLFLSSRLSQQKWAGIFLLFWLFAALCLLLFGALALLPVRAWVLVIRGTGPLIGYVILGAALAASFIGLSERLWIPMSGFTFFLVRLCLMPFLPVLVVQPEHFRIGSDRFTAIISPACSGVEGAALMIVFLGIWLILFRKEIRFPRALLLFPFAISVLLALNAVRIAALILIGHAGAREVAAQGFHSQAGWIVFNLVAFGISVGSRQVPFLWRHAAPRTSQNRARVAGPDAVSVYILPFLTVLIAGMLARAASGSFEWFYGVRLVAGGAALWYFRRSYSFLTGRFLGERRWDWSGPLAGAGVFLLWIAAEQLTGPSGTTDTMPQALRQTSLLWRSVWIGFRIATAVLVVPLVEELAFRGYLMRRFAGEDFENVPPQNVPWWGVIASSLLFGFLHGSRWAVGSVAGLVYALLYRRRNNLATPVIAHAFTNLLLAIYVILFRKWSLF